jgi:DNA replication protein DnaC
LTTLEETITKLSEMKLTSMVSALRELIDSAPGNQLSFEEKLGILVDREWTDRDNRRLARRLKDAKLATRASLDNVLCDPERGVDKAVMRQLANCPWVKSKHNVVIVGKTGVGKLPQRGPCGRRMPRGVSLALLPRPEVARRASSRSSSRRVLIAAR